MPIRWHLTRTRYDEISGKKAGRLSLKIKLQPIYKTTYRHYKGYSQHQRTQQNA
jgi:hypothetical protein